MLHKYKLNHVPSPPDSRDHVIKISAPLNSQQLIDLSQPSDTPKDQGDVGSCTAFAGVALMENFYHRNMGGTITDLLSEKFLYYATRVNIAKWPANEDSGAYLRDTMKAMVHYGVPLEKSFPYLRPDQKECTYADAPPPSVYTEATQYQVTRYATVVNSSNQQLLIDLKTLLQNGYSFIGGVICYENFFSDTQGLIPVPQGQIIGGHALTFVGYDDSRQVFKFKNSWGKSWGDQGYGYLPYHYVITGNLHDIWTIYAQEYQNKPFEISTAVDRKAEFSKRINKILIRLAQGVSLSTLIQEIKADSENKKIFSGDVTELINLSHRLSSSIKHAATMSARLKQ